MRISGYVTIILVIGCMLLIFGSITDSFGETYDVDVDTSWSTRWNFGESINSSISGMLKGMSDMGSGDIFKIFAGGFVVVLNIAILVPVVLLTAVTNGISFIIGAGGILGIPSEVVSYGIIGLTVLIVFAFIGWWRKYKT